MFHVDTQSTIPIYVQIKEQIKYLIFDGGLQPNTPLPSADLLSQNLQVNRNTVLRAYRELRDEGFVAFQPGKGTFIAEHPPAPRHTNGAVRGLVTQHADEVIHEALEGGMSKPELLALVMLRIQSYADGQNMRRIRAAFVECNLDRVNYYTGELARELQIEVVPLLLGDLREKRARTREMLQQVDLVISPFFHLADVRHALQDLAISPAPEVLATTIRPHLDVVARLARLPRGRRVAILYSHRDPDTEKTMNNMLQVLQRMDLHIELVPVYVYPEQTDIGERLAGFDVAVVQPENIQTVAHLIPGRVEVIEWSNVLDEASLEMLREAVRRAQSATP